MTLLRTLRINGRVLMKYGAPARRTEIQLRSAEGQSAGGVMTGPDGSYELRIFDPGRFYLGINLNHTATSGTPYPRWFYPGTEDPARAMPIDFSGHPDARTYDLTLPDRVIKGIVVTAGGQPIPRAFVAVLDSSRTVITQAISDVSGQFAVNVFAQTAYRLHAVWPGEAPGQAVSAVPTDIQPGSDPLDLRLMLTEPGNSYMDSQQRDGIR